ncbi:hypothetical protein LCGC14_3014330 [marine sediment metagenome]|uniref:Uncharacterized protein n=1 Tax=marine sediment metagenome TaxID=412755 RepID=A0A0F8Z4Y8_9ZZZZ
MNPALRADKPAQDKPAGKVKLTKAAVRVLQALQRGATIKETLIPVQPFLRGIGSHIPGRLVHTLGEAGGRVHYHTFCFLFREGLIDPTSRREVSDYLITPLGRRALKEPRK